MEVYGPIIQVHGILWKFMDLSFKFMEVHVSSWTYDVISLIIVLSLFII